MWRGRILGTVLLCRSVAGNWRNGTGDRGNAKQGTRAVNWAEDTGRRELALGTLRQGTGSREVEAWTQGTGTRELEAGNWKQGIGGRDLDTGKWETWDAESAAGIGRRKAEQ